MNKVSIGQGRPHESELGFAPSTKLVPNYNGTCEVCGASPTVTIKNKETNEVEEELDLCGPCCFGEASMLDVKEW